VWRIPLKDFWEHISYAGIRNQFPTRLRISRLDHTPFPRILHQESPSLGVTERTGLTSDRNTLEADLKVARAAHQTATSEISELKQAAKEGARREGLLTSENAKLEQKLALLRERNEELERSVTTAKHETAEAHRKEEHQAEELRAVNEQLQKLQDEKDFLELERDKLRADVAARTADLQAARSQQVVAQARAAEAADELSVFRARLEKVSALEGKIATVCKVLADLDQVRPVLRGEVPVPLQRGLP